MSDSLRPHGLYSPWNSPGQNTGVGSCSFLREMFPSQGLNPGLPHRRWFFLPAEPPGKPRCPTKKPDTKKLQKIFEKGSDGNQIDFFRKLIWIQDVGRSSLVAQWLGIRLPVQGNTSSVPSRGRSHIPQAANPGRHHCRALEPGSRNC